MQGKIECWREDYNEKRPNMSQEKQTLVEFVEA